MYHHADCRVWKNATSHSLRHRWEDGDLLALDGQTHSVDQHEYAKGTTDDADVKCVVLRPGGYISSPVDQIKI